MKKIIVLTVLFFVSAIGFSQTDYLIIGWGDGKGSIIASNGPGDYRRLMNFNDSMSFYINEDSILWNKGTSANWLNTAVPSLFGFDANGMAHVYNTNQLSITGGQVTTGLGYTPASVSGSYSNPSWITALAHSKITYTGTTSEYIRGDGTAIAFPALGEINTASNVGSGTGVFKQKSGVDLQFKSILGTANQLIVTSNTNDITLSLPSRSESSPSRSLVTSTSSTGFQPNATYDMQVTYSVYAQVTSALAGTNTADVYLEIAATNSTTPGDWTTKSRSGISIAGILSTSGNTQTVSCFVPKGYYVRIRTAATGSNAGSAVFTYQVGQENTY